MALLRGLPADSATMRAEGSWPDATELLAAIVEQIDALTRLTYSAASGRRPNWPALAVPRPQPQVQADDQPPRKREPTADEVVQMFGRPADHGAG